MDKDTLKQEIQKQARGAMSLFTAYIGIANGLFDQIFQNPSSLSQLELSSGMDGGYLERWLDAAYAFGYLEAKDGIFSISESGSFFLADPEESMMGTAVQAVLSGHMAERIAGFMKTGVRPGENLLVERDTIASLFGTMLEKSFSPFFENTILPSLDFMDDMNKQRGTVLDLGCGNGWYLRKILKRHTNICGIGIDGFPENIRQAVTLSEKDGIADRITFIDNDIFSFKPESPVHMLAMNRALHHVWDRREIVFENMRNFLLPGGHAVIWEPRWPDERSDLRNPNRQGMAFQNLSEHAQGNFLLKPGMIENEFKKVGMKTRTLFFANGNESVIIGEK